MSFEFQHGDIKKETHREGQILMRVDQEGWGLRKQGIMEDGKTATAEKSGQEPRECSPEPHGVGKGEAKRAVRTDNGSLGKVKQSWGGAQQ